MIKKETSIDLVKEKTSIINKIESAINKINRNIKSITIKEEYKNYLDLPIQEIIKIYDNNFHHDKKLCVNLDKVIIVKRYMNEVELLNSKLIEILNLINNINQGFEYE